MAAEEDLEVRSCAELSAGEMIEAWHRDRLVHRGTVSSTFEEIDLFWIIDARTGARRLLDLEQLSIRRVPVGKPAAAVATRKAAGSVKPKPAASLRQVVFMEAR